MGHIGSESLAFNVSLLNCSGKERASHDYEKSSVAILSRIRNGRLHVPWKCRQTG
jgi:hypothetical protein